MPSVSDSTEYASMIVQAFKNYFVDKLAFSPTDRPDTNIDIALVTGKQRPSIVNVKDFTLDKESEIQAVVQELISRSK
ncbi:hypothetical protein M2451_000619 [Dysgonomonas sp. PFB1-18]|uniref:hypothetical protein n=1 Tax=unclassified Dysgonomonas TaxID=2630389 RepID=UPI002475A1B0|nr:MULTISPECIES: hypothetical protein [unclassified Dysgonomonas]MDL2303537.1 hypothetical protein [Dysgonomonas sp. OttesenSCG-928-D17]MDH6307470.1 hypothetical protein [Dysgonomonas sp. PF1-14]MDH6337388.1 hypothetical protein [Dysgonomonas sp. PF1-16]MDH6379312.1 hypothetical protein [Dysgonomonas sp. PFB1-18]MDH6396050.1 hypothetical protein [Dysgonomonas sp. PF1-23]